MKLKIKIRLINLKITVPQVIEKGEWVDLRCADNYSLKQGIPQYLSLGIAMKLPKGFEAIIAPRSSTLKNFKLMCGNSIGIVDNSFSGNKDEWKFCAYPIADTIICTGDRICQFRIQLSQKATVWQKLRWMLSNGIELKEVRNLDATDRGGIGSTGIQ